MLPSHGASSLLDRAREHFGIFARAIRAEDEWKAASAAQETLRPQVEVLIAKKKQLAELDRQITELQSRRSAFATELSQEFESNKSCLTEYAANAKRADQLRMDKGIRHAEVIMGEVLWLELKSLPQDRSSNFALGLLFCKHLYFIRQILMRTSLNIAFFGSKYSCP